MVGEGAARLDDQAAPGRHGAARGAHREHLERRLRAGLCATEYPGGCGEHLERPGEIQDLDVVEDVDADVTHRIFSSSVR